MIETSLPNKKPTRARTTGSGVFTRAPWEGRLERRVSRADWERRLSRRPYSPPGGAISNRPPGAACFTRRLGGASFQAPVFFARKGDFQSPPGSGVFHAPTGKGVFPGARILRQEGRFPIAPPGAACFTRRLGGASFQAPYSSPGGAISNRPLEGRFLAAPCSSPKWETSSKLPIPDNRRAPLAGALRSRIAPPTESPLPVANPGARKDADPSRRRGRRRSRRRSQSATRKSPLHPPRPLAPFGGVRPHTRVAPAISRFLRDRRCRY